MHKINTTKLLCIECALVWTDRISGVSTTFWRNCSVFWSSFRFITIWIV